MQVIAQHKREKRQIPEDTIQAFITDICQGVAFLHSKKVIHRDLKSANILLDTKGRAKIADFGTLRTLSHTQSVVQTQGGTPGYQSPELCRGGYTQAADIWAIGCIFYELCMLEVWKARYAK